MEENKQTFDESIVEENAAEVSSEEEDKQTQETAETEKEAAEETQQEEAKAGSGKKKKKSAKVLEMELKKSEEKAAELTDKYQRLMAEFENARKRNAKEQTRMYDVGAKEVLQKLLPVVDNFERGLDALSQEGRTFCTGRRKNLSAADDCFWRTWRKSHGCRRQRV